MYSNNILAGGIVGLFVVRRPCLVNVEQNVSSSVEGIFVGSLKGFFLVER